ncbi:hypothetical protein RDI58_021080 [Solanum bulbocastanum]|uniref:Uncharacterized protein n=2 Tax=Solanum TaxID=4107 RepID=A0AAN8YBA2_SOLBU
MGYLRSSFVFSLLAFVTFTYAATIEVRNNCPYTV